jgi:hypothetical protein
VGDAQASSTIVVRRRGLPAFEISVARSRETRRQSSSLGLGGTVMAQTRGSPRCQAISVRRSVRSLVGPSFVLPSRWPFLDGASADIEKATGRLQECGLPPIREFDERTNLC